VARTKGEQTRQAILRAAITRFGRDGFRATSVADIARDAGVGGTVAYAYFPNKETLFLAAVDEDAAAVIHEGVTTVIDQLDRPAGAAKTERADAGGSQPSPGVFNDWRTSLIFTLLDAVEQHPLARRLLGGLEPHVTERVLDIPALADLRKAVADRLHAEQLEGLVRHDVDPATMANGIVAIFLSLLMSVVQVGRGAALAYGPDVAAVIQAALGRPGGPTAPS
jgi:AcrR family transcriptional regulator